jgi:hypothetical protein
MVRLGGMAGLVVLCVAASGCAGNVFGDDPAKGTLVRIVELEAADLLDIGEPNDAEDLLALARTRFEYTHAGDAVSSDDVTVRFQDDDGRERELPLSRFTDSEKVGRGDEVTLDGILLTSRVEVLQGDRVLAARGGPPQDWLEVGGYPLPITAQPDAFAAWALDGETSLLASLDRLRVVSNGEDYEYGCDEVLDEDGQVIDYRCSDSSTPYTDTVTVTGADGQATIALDATLSLEGTGTESRPRIEGVLEGSVRLGSSLDSHVQHDRTGTSPEHLDADFGFDLDAEAAGDGLARFTFGSDRQLRTVGGSGDLLVTADLVAWDDEHPKAERWRPAGLDDPLFEESAPYTEEDVPSEDTIAFVAEALADLWRMDLAPGDEFRASFDTARMGGVFGAGTPGMEGSLLIRVMAAEAKEVPAGTFDTWRIETTTEFSVDAPDGPQGFDLPSTTMWIDQDSGVPIALVQGLELDYGLEDAKSLLGLVEELGDDVDIEEPRAMSLSATGSTSIVLTEWEEGLRMAPMYSVLSPFMGFGMPLSSLLFAPMGMLGSLGGFDGYEGQTVPNISFSKDSAERTVVVVMAEASDWSEFGITTSSGAGCVAPPYGPVHAGDIIDCSAAGSGMFTLRIAHLPTNTLVYETTFS